MKRIWRIDMKRNKIYRWWHWDSKHWSIDINPCRCYFGFWFTKYQFGIGIGIVDIGYISKKD